MRILARLTRLIGILICWIVALLVHSWSFGALYYCSFPAHPPVRIAAAMAYLILIILFIAVCRKRTRAVLISYGAFLAVAVWFSSIQPRTDAVYPAHLRMPFAEFKGNIVTIHNVRNCEYRTRDDFDVHYEARTYNIDELETVDMFVNYWGMDLIAHVFVSFGFSDGEYLAVSLETRPEVGETYGELKGLFKQYELIYIWADERDLVRLRTNYRKEDVYLYRIQCGPAPIRTLFKSMLKRTNALYRKPAFYNTCIQSCTNTIGNHIIKENIYSIPFWKRRLLTGTIDRRVYMEGFLDQTQPFDELRQAALINERAQAADKDSNFSRKIRTHL